MHDVQHVRCFIAGIVPSGGIVRSIGLSGPPTSSTFEARLHCNVPPGTIVPPLKTPVLLLDILLHPSP